MNFINNNEKDFITWQQAQYSQVVTNPFMLENAINALGWFTQHWQDNVLTDGTQLNELEAIELMNGTINVLAVSMTYLMDTSEPNAVNRQTISNFSALMKYQTIHPSDFKEIAKLSRNYLDVIGA